MMPKFCPECGFKSEGGNFCMECGTKLGEVVALSTKSPIQCPSVKRSQQSLLPRPANLPNPSISSAQPTPSPPAPAIAVFNEPIPSAVAGVEAQQCYEKCISTIRATNGGNNEASVEKFKQNCKMFGFNQIGVEFFYGSLVADLGKEGTKLLIPTLARLIPDTNKRRELIEYNWRISTNDVTPAATIGTAYGVSEVDGSSFSSTGSSGRVKSNPEVSKGILKNRYADHPTCDICHGVFEVTRRRHQCRLCGLYACSQCSPLKLLIPPGKQIQGAKGYDPSVPQRVCIQCAPELHPIQEELVKIYAQANEQNLHEAKGRIHVPFSSSLQKECRNAADIIGNFFRDDWGATSDRAIPIAFLQKAHGIAIMTIIKAGFLVTGKIGTGLVVAKLPDGSWSAPSAIGTVGLGGGFEIGGEIVEIMIILGSEGAVKVFHKPQVNLGAGLDIAVGPYGRSAVAAAAASKSGLNANYSYSLSKGLYAGISLQSAVIATRTDLNRKFYGRELEVGDILTGRVEQPNAAKPLYDAIAKAMQEIDVRRDEAALRSSIMGACRVCSCPTFIEHTTQIWNKNCKACKHIH